MSEQPEEWVTQDSGVAGSCMACTRPHGLVLVRNDVRLCFTCAMEAGKAIMLTTGFARPKRRGKEES